MCHYMFLVAIIISATQGKDYHQCGLRHYVNAADDSAHCPVDLPRGLLAITNQYILPSGPMMEALKEKKIGGDLNFVHFGHKYYPQWLLSYYKDQNVMFLYFQGTEMYRLPELMIDLDITHTEYALENEKVIRTSGSMTSVIDRADAFRHMLEQELQYIFTEYKIKDDESKKEETRWVIAGTSLGGVYAGWWYLSLYGGVKADHNISTELVGEYFPSNKSKVSVILMGAPLFIFHKDVENIDKEVRDRIFNFIIPLDPVPMVAGGHNPLHFAGADHVYNRVGKWALFKDGQKRLELASNAPIGRYYVLSGKKESLLSKVRGFFGSKKKKETKPVCPLQKMDPDAVETHLGNGGHCLWDSKRLDKSTMGVAGWFMKYHAKALPALLTTSNCTDESALEKVKESKRTYFYIKFCDKPTTLGKLEECYDYEYGKKTKSDDFINPLVECKCYEKGGLMDEIRTGYNMLAHGKFSIKNI